MNCIVTCFKTNTKMVKEMQKQNKMEVDLDRDIKFASLALSELN